MLANIQETFLKSVVENKNPITIFLLNGIKLQGVMTGFDDHVVVLRRDGQMQVIYKQAISTIMPSVEVAELK